MSPRPAAISQADMNRVLRAARKAGASVSELNAVLGWSGAKMAMHYTAKADRARLARSAMERLKK